MKKFSNGYQMVSFDATSLFTKVPLDQTIQLVLKRIYEKHEVSTNITKQEMKEMLILFTKNVHLTFNEEVYKKTDGVAMGSPLGPVLADIFMVELKNNIVPVLQENLSFWKRYVDHTIYFVKIGTINYITTILNNFDPNITFTYEVEKYWKLPFLDAFLIKKGKHKTSVNNASEESQFSPVTDLKHHLLVLPYQSQKGDFIIKSMKKRLQTLTK